jgi:hypothetical protein
LYVTRASKIFTTISNSNNGRRKEGFRGVIFALAAIDYASRVVLRGAVTLQICDFNRTTILTA